MTYKNEIESEITKDHHNFINSLKTNNPDFKVLDYYNTKFVYNIDRLPRELIKKYQEGDKKPLLTLIFLLETECRIHILLQTFKKEDDQLWVDFLRHNEITKDFFNMEVIFYDYSKLKTEKIKVSDIEDDIEKLKSLADVMDKHRRENYNCAPYYVVALLH